MKQMHLGLSTYTFPWNVMLASSLPSHSFSFREMLQFTSDNHIHFFQFGDNYPLHLLSKNELTEIKELALEKNIQLQVGTRSLHIDHITKYISIASQLNSAFLRVVIDDENYRPAEKDVVQIIHALLPSLKESGIVLAIENHDRFKAETLVQIIKQTDTDFVGICLDTANSLGAGESIVEILPVLLPYTINLHVKDFIVTRVHHKMGFTVSGTAAGSGMLDIPWLLNECSRYKRCSTATLELWMDEEVSAEQTLAKEISLVGESIKFLKKYIS
jgi:sugar phosphate isomerase/epimerase